MVNIKKLRMPNFMMVSQQNNYTDKHSTDREISRIFFLHSKPKLKSISPVQYSSLNGDSDPVQENNYKSFFIEGPNKD